MRVICCKYRRIIRFFCIYTIYYISITYLIIYLVFSTKIIFFIYSTCIIYISR
nr:MAG TPA: hypothetical protein [Caudoviricetes sp.]